MLKGCQCDLQASEAARHSSCEAARRSTGFGVSRRSRRTFAIPNLATIPTHYQLESFLGRISPHFHKPAARFIGDMIYGIMVEKDVKLSSVVRASKNWGTSKPNLHGMSTRTVKKRCVEFVGAHSTSSVRFSLPRTVYLRTTPFVLRFGDHDT